MSYSVSFGKHFVRSVSPGFSSALLVFSSHSFLVSFSRSFETQMFSKFPFRASLHLSYAILGSCVTSCKTVPQLPPKIWWHQSPWLKPRSFFQVLYLYNQLSTSCFQWVALTVSLIWCVLTWTHGLLLQPASSLLISITTKHHHHECAND